jgi:fluoroquinolone resistance protein
MGLNFSLCNDFLFEASFLNCNLDYCSFFQKKMKKAKFSDCSMKEADLAEVDLTMAVFQQCDLENASFAGTLLEKADFRTAKNYILDPENNIIRKARFSYPGVIGLLAKYNIEIEF